MSGWKALDILHHAHQVGLEKMKTMEEAVESLKSGEVDFAVARLKDLLAFFNGELKVHFAHEEEALFPPLSRAIGPMGPVAVMLAEHRSLWQAVDTLEEELDRLQRGAEISTLPAQQVASHIVWALRSHIQKEDEMLFPTAEKYLSELDKHAVTSRIEAA